MTSSPVSPSKSPPSSCNQAETADLSRQTYLGFFDQSAVGDSLNWSQLERAAAVSNPDPCPYLAGEVERKLIMPRIDGSIEEASIFNRAGFRRSHEYFYRPICQDCSACKPLRIKTADFSLNKSAKRLLKRHQNLQLAMISDLEAQQSWISEHWILFKSYVVSRHKNGGWMRWTAMC